MNQNALSLKQRINEDMKSALRAGDKRRLGIVRLILAAIKQREIDERIVLDDGQAFKIMDKLLKQRRDSIVQYQAAGRQDLVEQETYEAEVLQEYMPVALSEAEIDALIDDAITSIGAASARDIGKVIGSLKSQMQGRADMAKVSSRIKSKLSAS